jgi:purine nucleoside permease
MSSYVSKVLLQRVASCLLAILLMGSCSGRMSQAQIPAKPWPIRVVIVTTFEGEYRLWGEREHLTESIEEPGLAFPLHTNTEHTVLGVISGTSIPTAASATLLLGVDPRFDLTHAYFIINGIAGTDPEDASLGSAAWANYVVGDVMKQIDPREMPKEWPYGLFPSNSKEPNPKELRLNDPIFGKNAFALNPKLVAWAFEQTRELKLLDSEKAATIRSAYAGYPNAQRPPSVMIGGDFASDFYWHGKIMNQFANDWVKLYTGGKGNFVMTNTEDSGYMNAIMRLDEMHRVDKNRVLILRTASNYSMQPEGMSAYDSLTAPFGEGGRLAFESEWLCGSTVMHKLVDNWDRYRDHIPGN